jgi:putative methyltransferase (TIGR04325 family)
MSNSKDFQLQHTWDQAKRNGSTYENPKIIANFAERISLNKPWETKKNQFLNEREFQLLAIISMLAGKNKKLSIVDLGGGNGYMCHFLRVWLPDTEISYTIIESEGIVNAYKAFEGESQINWRTDFPQPSFDIALTSCTLQYLDDPADSLKSLIQLANNLIILRFPKLVGPDPKYAVQVLPMDGTQAVTSVPVRFFGNGFLESTIPKEFQRVFEFYHHDETLLIDNESVTLTGHLFQKN